MIQGDPSIRLVHSVEADVMKYRDGANISTELQYLESDVIRKIDDLLSDNDLFSGHNYAVS